MTNPIIIMPTEIRTTSTSVNICLINELDLHYMYV